MTNPPMTNPPATNPTRSDESLTLPPAQEYGWKQIILSLLGTLMFGAMFTAMCIFTVPSLVSDWQVRNTAEPVAEGRVTKGSCSSKLVLNICDATLSLRAKAGTVTRDVNFVFLDVHSGDYTVDVMADPAQPELVTTDLALSKLWNRTITMLVSGGALLALTIAPIVAIVRTRQRRREEGLA